MQTLTPREIVESLDRDIIGQSDAKRAVAIAIRNRYRRRQLPRELAHEVTPKNIIMIGPTGVGKTEIARRLAALTDAPFVKVEASKFTEVGYHGRDVESMIRDLLEQAITMVKREQAETVKDKAQAAADERVIDLLLPGSGSSTSEPDVPSSQDSESGYVPVDQSIQRKQEIRQRLLDQLHAGKLNDREVEISVSNKGSASMFLGTMGADQMDPSMADMLENMMPSRTERRRVTVEQACGILLEQETDKLLDQGSVNAKAIQRTEEQGIVFLDEIDKIASPANKAGLGGSPDVSRQGVQRDLLPIVEGSAVSTRHGTVNTDHILFVAAGAFHNAAVSDLMPELQGRFPIRVELQALGKEDFIRILTEPRGALTYQQKALLETEGLEVHYEDAAIDAIAELAVAANATTQNIGARRLMTVMEKVFEEVNFDASDRVAQGETSWTVTETYVRERVGPIASDGELSRFVL